MIEIDVDDVEVTIETEGLTCESNGPGLIQIQEIDSAVAVSLREGRDNKIASSFIKNTALLNPDAAKIVAEESELGDFSKLQADTSVCDFWINMGWWYHDATILHDDDGERMAYLDIGQRENSSYLALEIVGSDHEGNAGGIQIETTLSKEHRDEFVAALLKVAKECESEGDEQMEEESDASEKTVIGRIKRMLLYESEGGD